MMMTIFLPSLSSLFLSLYSSVSTYYINSIDSQRNEIKMLVTFLKCATIHTVVVAAALSPKNPNKIISRENHVKCLKFFFDSMPKRGIFSCFPLFLSSVGNLMSLLLCMRVLFCLIQWAYIPLSFNVYRHHSL